jgi:hypothetical protein
MPAKTIGSYADAAAVLASVEWWGSTNPRVTLIGKGEDRYAYLLHGVVYKIGTRASANRYDHETQVEARRRRYRWAPTASTLYEVPDEWRIPVPILAMSYHPDDGTTPDPAALADMMRQSGGGVDPTNFTVTNRQPIVIDFCTVELGPA